MKRLILSFVAVLSAALVIGCASEPYSPPEPEPMDLTLIWQDEFNGSEDDLPDDSKWSFDIGGHGWGNEQLEYDTGRADNVSLDGQGHLRIIAREESFGGNAYTSGRIKTQGKFAHAYGRFEARIQLPVGQGLWPAFWLLGSDINSVSWPGCGEIDIMEYRGQAPNLANGALHGPGYSGGRALSGSYLKSGAGFHQGFHVFAIEWSETAITWYVDDVSYMTKRTSNLPSGADWVFDHPFFILLNVAVGGNYVGSPDASTVFPQTMLVDYVRVYAAR